MVGSSWFLRCRRVVCVSAQLSRARPTLRNPRVDSAARRRSPYGIGSIGLAFPEDAPVADPSPVPAHRPPSWLRMRRFRCTIIFELRSTA
jgi:hypothetical protein